MKKIFTLSALTVLTVFFAGCVRENVGFDENYWLSKERGVVVYSDYCEYYVVETSYGYAVMRAPGSYKPYEGATVYGNFSNYGMRDFYNRSSGRIFTSDVTEYWLSYTAAQDAIYYYCPNARNKFNKIAVDTTSN